MAIPALLLACFIILPILLLFIYIFIPSEKKRWMSDKYFFGAALILTLSALAIAVYLATTYLGR